MPPVKCVARVASPAQTPGEASLVTINKAKIYFCTTGFQKCSVGYPKLM